MSRSASLAAPCGPRRRPSSGVASTFRVGAGDRVSPAPTKSRGHRRRCQRLPWLRVVHDRLFHGSRGAGCPVSSAALGGPEQLHGPAQHRLLPPVPARRMRRGLPRGGHPAWQRRSMARRRRALLRLRSLRRGLSLPGHLGERVDGNRDQVRRLRWRTRLRGHLSFASSVVAR